MAYKMELPSLTLKRLWLLRKYCARGPIVQQVRKAVSDYIKSQEEKFGIPVEDIAETIERHERETKSNQEDWRVNLENQIKSKNRRLSKKLY